MKAGADGFLTELRNGKDNTKPLKTKKKITAARPATIYPNGVKWIRRMASGILAVNGKANAGSIITKWWNMTVNAASPRSESSS